MEEISIDGLLQLPKNTESVIKPISLPAADGMPHT